VAGSGPLERARLALGRGDPLIAYDEATEAIAQSPGDLDARYIHALALARAGSARRAAYEAEQLRLGIGDDADVPLRLREDVEALRARLEKDRALAATGETRVALAAQAAAAYEDVGRRLRGHYSCANAATLWLVAGDRARADELATLAQCFARESRDDDPDDEYWRAVTEAEAFLVLGDTNAAHDALSTASKMSAADVAAIATTRRQLAQVCTVTNTDESVLDPLVLPTIVHYSGHAARATELERRFPAALEASVVATVDDLVGARRIGFGYGSMACGADIVIAEALLRRGVELHVVLPFDAHEFEEVSVRSGGEQWVPRFRVCLANATSVTHACDSYLGDDALFGYAASVVMGHALNRAAFLGAEAFQIAVWDGGGSTGPAGTGHDVEKWGRTGRETIVIDAPRVARDPFAVPNDSAAMGRSVRAIVFTDLHGFSRLRDEDYPVVLKRVIAPIAAVLDRFAGAILARKTWGDAVHIVCSDVASAARAALAIQELVTDLDRSEFGLPDDFRMRVGAHVGPVLEWLDPIGGVPTFWGREVTRAAYIEPRTPEGEVYVTDPFAALLTLDAPDDLRCEYVGQITTAKDFETIPMYRLCRTPA
jgi:hypothetical protein